MMANNYLYYLIPFLGGIFAFLGGIFTAIFSEPLRQWLFRPKLRMEFNPSKDGYISKTIEVNTGTGTKTANAHYIRVKVINKSLFMARDCKAFLINIEKFNNEKKIIPTIYCDSIQLAWSCMGSNDHFPGLDIPKGLNQFIDVIVTRNTKTAYDPQIMCKPFRYTENLFKETGTFIFTIQVCASGTTPKKMKLKFIWSGAWDKYSVDVFKNENWAKRCLTL